MTVRIKKNSRLRFSPLTSVAGVEFWDFPELPDLPVQDDDIAHTVTQLDRSDLLASKYYGDPVLWWVIALANDREIFQTGLNVGEVLRIPSPRYVLQEMFKSAIT